MINNCLPLDFSRQLFQFGIFFHQGVNRHVTIGAERFQISSLHIMQSFIFYMMHLEGPYNRATFLLWSDFAKRAAETIFPYCLFAKRFPFIRLQICISVIAHNQKFNADALPLRVREPDGQEEPALPFLGKVVRAAAVNFRVILFACFSSGSQTGRPISQSAEPFSHTRAPDASKISIFLILAYVSRKLTCSRQA